MEKIFKSVSLKRSFRVLFLRPQFRVRFNNKNFYVFYCKDDYLLILQSFYTVSTSTFISVDKILFCDSFITFDTFLLYMILTFFFTS